VTALRDAILAGGPTPAVEPPRISYAPTPGGAHVGYLRRGVGPPWLLAMGCDAHISVAHLDEEPVTAAVERRLAGSVGLIRLDRPGIGLSDPFPENRGPTGEEWAQAALAVADHAGLDRFVVLGTGWSTPAAIALAATHPERVQGLIVFNGFARFTRAPDYPIGIPPELVERFRRSVLDTSQETMPTELDDGR
jgi:pimeloyl-ACP methyl ester carboxylesterase